MTSKGIYNPFTKSLTPTTPMPQLPPGQLPSYVPEPQQIIFPAGTQVVTLSPTTPIVIYTVREAVTDPEQTVALFNGSILSGHIPAKYLRSATVDDFRAMVGLGPEVSALKDAVSMMEKGDKSDLEAAIKLCANPPEHLWPFPKGAKVVDISPSGSIFDGVWEVVKCRNPEGDWYVDVTQRNPGIEPRTGYGRAASFKLASSPVDTGPKGHNHRQSTPDLMPGEIETLPNGAKQSKIGHWWNLPHAMLAVGEVMNEGRVKYDTTGTPMKANFHGIPVWSNVQHAITHLFLWMIGNKDEDHLAHAGARILMALEVREGGYDKTNEM